MPIAAPAITSAILAANPTLTGPAWVQTATAIGIAVQTWAVIPANVVLVGSVNGTVGGGAVTGKFLMQPVPLPVSAAVAASGLLGLQASQVALAVGLGVSTSLNATAAYVGTSTGAIGVDISKVTFANPATLTPLITSNMAAQGIFGPVAAQLALGLGNGIATMVLTGGGTGAAVGAAGPAPGTGVSRSSLI